MAYISQLSITHCHLVLLPPHPPTPPLPGHNVKQRHLGSNDNNDEATKAKDRGISNIDVALNNCLCMSLLNGEACDVVVDGAPPVGSTLCLAGPTQQRCVSCPLLRFVLPADADSDCA